MTSRSSAMAASAGFVVTHAPDLQNLLNQLAQGIAPATGEGTIR